MPSGSQKRTAKFHPETHDAETTCVDLGPQPNQAILHPPAGGGGRIIHIRRRILPDKTEFLKLGFDAPAVPTGRQNQHRFIRAARFIANHQKPALPHRFHRFRQTIARNLSRNHVEMAEMSQRIHTNMLNRKSPQGLGSAVQKPGIPQMFLELPLNARMPFLNVGKQSLDAGFGLGRRLLLDIEIGIVVHRQSLEQCHAPLQQPLDICDGFVPIDRMQKMLPALLHGVDQMHDARLAQRLGHGRYIFAENQYIDFGHGNRLKHGPLRSSSAGFPPPKARNASPRTPGRHSTIPPVSKREKPPDSSRDGCSR